MADSVQEMLPPAAARGSGGTARGVMSGRLRSIVEIRDMGDVHIAEGGGEEHNLFDLFQNVVLTCDQRQTSSTMLCAVT
jgi:hypothetical protein